MPTTALADATQGLALRSLNGKDYRLEGDGDGALLARLVGPLSGFGELLMVEPLPRVQIDATYGILTTDVETFTASGGSATASGGVFSTATGVSSGAYGMIRSRRMVRYRAGQALRVRFTAMFSAGVASGLQGAGMFTATDGIFFGRSGTSFGLFRRIAGACSIYRLTITNGATGAENMTITLNSTAVVVASGGALSTAATAERIAEVGVFTGWTSTVSPTSNGATVTFIQQVPAATGGAFSFSSSGGATGTLAEVQAGAANDNATGFVVQTAWNVDRMDGSGGAYNPSGETIDPTKLNVYEVLYPHLGAGTIVFRVMTPRGRWQTVHRIEYPDSATIPSQRSPTMRVGWFAASLGSTTNITTSGVSAALFVDGNPPSSARDPYSTTRVNFSAGTTEYAALCIRSRGEFSSTVNLREVVPVSINGANETANRAVRVRVLVNPTLTGTVDWSYVDQSTSCVEVATPATITPSGGREVASGSLATATTIELDKLDLRLEPGDVLVVALTTASSTAACNVGVNWQER